MEILGWPYKAITYHPPTFGLSQKYVMLGEEYKP